MIVIRDITAESTHRDSLASFAGTVAHDLNNPLSVIDGWAEALEDELTGNDSHQAAEAAPMVQHIRASVEQMRSLISDLLAHTRARDQNLECEQIALAGLVKHIVATHDRPRQGGEIVAGDLLDVWADRVLLQQVLDNLVGNAVKYVRPGAVPRVLIEAEPATEGWALVRVRDNGIGVPAQHRERIFESFHRASSDDYRGTGLGLAICRRIIQRHGGTIHVTDNPDGVGSCFEFTMPMTPEAFQRATGLGTTGA
jgi:signal transduction histidine kinase